MHAWRPHVKNDKARFCLGPRECQRGGPRGIVVGPTWNVTVFGRGAIPWVTNGATGEKRSLVASTCQTCQRWKRKRSKLLTIDSLS
jgi:hypothetical protein